MSDSDVFWDQLRLAVRAPLDFVQRFAITYPGNPARQELLDRLNTRWRDGEEPPARATHYGAHL
jgi:hypothetical protein